MKFLVAFLAVVAVVHAYVPRLDGRIVGGQDADIRDHPYQVSVRTNDRHFCGGSILNANTILTAGHCVKNYDYSKLSVREGNTFHDSGLLHRVSQVILNSNYNSTNFDNDLAILKLSSSISFDIYAQPIALQPEGVEVVAGTTAWVSGWGQLNEGNNSTPASLRAVDVAVITNSECSKKFGNGKISSHMLCAATLGHDHCYGDSGGPLVADGKLIGVVSWGIGCARPLYPGVYAKVSDMYSWIISNSY